MTGIEKAAQRQTREYRARSLANNYRRYDSEHGFCVEKTVTAKWVLSHVLSDGCKCEYCGCDKWKVLGLDRKDCSIGHEEGNVVVACSTCNIARGDAFDYENFKKISKFAKPIKNSMTTMKLYEPTRIEDYLALGHGPNRPLYQSHVEEILQAMYKGTLEKRAIEVEMNTMKILSGQHRVKAQIEYYERTGKLYDLKILFVDLGGDEERMRNYVISDEAEQKGWQVRDYIHAFKGTPQYDRFMSWMMENGQTDYKIAEWVLGLNAKSIKSNNLIIPEHRYEAASKAIRFCKIVFDENSNSMPSEHVDELYHSKFLHIAVSTIFDAEIRGNKEDRKVIGMQVRMINEIASHLPNGFFDFARYFYPVIRDAEIHREKIGKKPNSSDWIRFIFGNSESIEKKVLKSASKNSVRRQRKMVSE